ASLSTSVLSARREKNQWNHCPALVAKIFRFPFDPNHRLIACILSRWRGVSRSSRTLGWDAVDADALLTNSADADGEVVWSRRPDAGVKFSRSKLLGMTVTIKPVTEESTKETVKTIAQGRPDCLR